MSMRIIVPAKKAAKFAADHNSLLVALFVMRIEYRHGLYVFERKC